MSNVLRQRATVEFECGIATECEQKDCSFSDRLHAFVVAGDVGRNGVAVYCSTHAQSREHKDTHTYVGEVTDYGGGANE